MLRGAFPSCLVAVAAAAVVAQDLAFLTEMLRVLFALVRYVQSIRIVQRTLFMGVDVDVALDAVLSHVGPGVAAHPFPFTFGTFVLSKTALLPLVWSQASSFGTSLRTVLDVVPLVEAEVAEVVRRRVFAGFPWVRGQGQIGEMVG